jgi:hypothetical protein
MYTAEAKQKHELSISQPSVGQMLELQKIGVVLAKEQKKLKRSRQKGNAHIFLSEQVERSEVLANDKELRYSSHRFTGRVARIGYHQWSMRLAEAFWIRDLELGQDDGFRASYTFEWNDSTVLRAFKNVRARRDDEAESYSDEPTIKALEKLEHWTDFWAVIGQTEVVSGADCSLLIASMKAYGDESRSDRRIAEVAIAQVT